MDRGRGGPPRGRGGPPGFRGGPPRGRGGPPRGRGGGGFKKSEPDAPRVNSEVQIFVENLPRDIKIPEVCQFFSTVGKIKVDRITKKPRVWVYHDKASGEPTGECTITYNDRESQQLALQTYDGEKMRGQMLREGRASNLATFEIYS